ncbi:oxalate:formate antiporter [Methylobacterium phyllosphaerae]|jgi:OFA family oxalate/formate antiporter-like MFS transporter|uniref:MFS transporter, OFA family, oxalate/formate antiporter n=3 Tax=Methylobacterium TaxID=407 RepID=A0AAE8HQC5_9HYPH|nr:MULTISPECIES: oxalate/formate MFS antiporter [Methylobacterium]APT31524.1 oxalate:formate antiporter [Methylobacterium phyllosphaerae]MBA9061869.1 OFA family oxalate/formate antiporter-like MFS transporter [Methylobacterium fujisawaense]MBP30762.1 oxalate/formate MFS antiporter [Methylobacterium sp.]MDE4912647.1 oxalate/formate MFS antiporter [Methylobacterium sp. 092160098-2]MDH3028136.1 oxalate/formate MFS antiporter [Methylobacterium fujisawaense]
MSEIVKPAGRGRWLQLAFGVVCMCMIANMQYGWTFFVNPMQERHGWDRAAIQVAFTLFVVTETWLVPIEGWFVDKYGPRIVTLFGGLLCGIAWVINSYADSLTVLYIAAAIGGTGAGAVYGTCVGNSLKWFPDRRGLAAGITAMGFGAGSALTVVPIQAMIKSQGYEAAFFYFGIGQGVIVMLIALFLRSPAKGQVPEIARVSQSKRDYKPSEMVRTPIFWVMYAMFVMMAAGGLMATAQLGPIAKDFKIADVPVSLLGITLPALTFAATLDRVLNGVTRPFFGWVSDHIGRENTMFLSFAIEGLGIYALSQFGQNPIAFVLLTGLVFFAWGEIYSLFPATCGDTFGSKYAATNAGLLYTAKGTAALIVPYTSVLTTMTGSWHAVFLAAAALNIVAALLALFVLKPMRAAYTKKPEASLAPVLAQ